MMEGPLKGIRVLGWTHWQQGPVATAMLGDLGADVIKIEQRITGDAGRGLVFIKEGKTLDLTIGGNPAFFEINNRNSRSIALDLTNEEGKQIVYRLVRTADVFVQNFRQGVAERLGMDYQTLSQHNPKLIYANSSGYGSRGPLSGEPAYDYLGLALSGFMRQTDAMDPSPVFVGRGVADQMGGTLTAYGILAALLARERLGIGQELDVSFLGSMIWLQYMPVSVRVMVDFDIEMPERHEPTNPLASYYRCADGCWIMLSMPQADRYWPDFCKVMEIAELEKDPRFENMNVRQEHGAELVSILDRLFVSKRSAEWVRQLRAAGLIVSPVNTIADLEKDPQVLANEYITEFEHPGLGRKTKMVGIPIRLSRTPGSIRLPAPQLGQHTEEILLEVGYGWEEIAKLKEQEVI